MSEVITFNTSTNIPSFKSDGYAAVVLPTTGADTLERAVDSILSQTYKNTKFYLVIDGSQHTKKTDLILNKYLMNSNTCFVDIINDNVGANGFYGHRIYAAYSHLVNSDYILFHDQDCWFDHEHVESMVDCIESNNYDWCYSLRKIVSKGGEFICNDNCESLGVYNPVLDYNFCDTNTYCIRTKVATKVSSMIHGGWGQDRVYYSVLSTAFKKFGCTGKYTVNYRLDGNQDSVKPEFFHHYNNIVAKKYDNVFPWAKK